MSVALYGEALSAARPAVRVRFSDGTLDTLDIDRWCAHADAVDDLLLARTSGPTLDIGCGPGRLTARLAELGRPALGIDIAPVAVRLARARGASVLRRSVFGPVPASGRWQHALLADGNVGIGGDPAALLVRTSDLLAPGGSVHVELAAPGTAGGALRARLETVGVEPGAWFPWARLPASHLAEVAVRADLLVRETWTAGGRWFAELVTRG